MPTHSKTKNINQTRAFWIQIFNAWHKAKRHGMSITRFCSKHCLSQSAFFAWRRKLGPAGSKGPLFVPLNDSALSLPPAKSLLPGQPLELVLPSGQVLRIPNGFDSDSLLKVLALLNDKEARSC